MQIKVLAVLVAAVAIQITTGTSKFSRRIEGDKIDRSKLPSRRQGGQEQTPHVAVRCTNGCSTYNALYRSSGPTDPISVEGGDVERRKGGKGAKKPKSKTKPKSRPQPTEDPGSYDQETDDPSTEDLENQKEEEILEDEVKGRKGSKGSKKKHPKSKPKSRSQPGTENSEEDLDQDYEQRRSQKDEANATLDDAFYYAIGRRLFDSVVPNAKKRTQPDLVSTEEDTDDQKELHHPSDEKSIVVSRRTNSQKSDHQFGLVFLGKLLWEVMKKVILVPVPFQTNASNLKLAVDPDDHATLDDDNGAASTADFHRALTSDENPAHELAGGETDADITFYRKKSQQPKERGDRKRVGSKAKPAIDDY